MFATLFVYDASGKPTFYTATLSHVGRDVVGAVVSRRPARISRVRAFDPAQVAARAVGTMTFTPVDSGRGRVAVLGGRNERDEEREAADVALRRLFGPLCDRHAARDDALPGRRRQRRRMVLGNAGRGASGHADRTADWTLGAAHMPLRRQLTCRRASSAPRRRPTTAATAKSGDIAFFELTKRNGFIAGRFQGHAITNGCDYRGQFAGIAAN